MFWVTILIMMFGLGGETALSTETVETVNVVSTVELSETGITAYIG